MSRDDQFKGWAKAVLAKMEHPDDGRHVWWESDSDLHFESLDTKEVWTQILARAGYDFACHIASYVSEGNAAAIEVRFKSPQEVVDDIPDMPELPQETEQ